MNGNTWSISYQTFGEWYICNQTFSSYIEALKHASYLRSFGIVTATRIQSTGF